MILFHVSEFEVYMNRMHGKVATQTDKFFFSDFTTEPWNIGIYREFLVFHETPTLKPVTKLLQQVQDFTQHVGFFVLYFVVLNHENLGMVPA